MEAGGNATQTWTPVFVDPGYDLALPPGFSGVENEVNGESCLASTQDRDLAKVVMRICDESMSVLTGPRTSVGRLLAIADNVRDNGIDRMPGYCCMDVATGSQFSGYHVSDRDQDRGSLRAP